MDQYSNTILHLPDYQATSEATIEERQTEQGPVMVQTIHGMVTTSIPDSCQHCGGRVQQHDQDGAQAGLRIQGHPILFSQDLGQEQEIPQEPLNRKSQGETDSG